MIHWDSRNFFGFESLEFVIHLVIVVVVFYVVADHVFHGVSPLLWRFTTWVRLLKVVQIRANFRKERLNEAALN